MTSDVPSRWRRIPAVTVTLVLLAACSSTAVQTTLPADPQAPATSLAPGTAQADPAAILADALARYSDGYEYTATVMVNDQTASVVDGRWLNGASELVVKSGAGEVEYLITGGGQWARLPDGVWESLDGVPSGESPLATLARPSSFKGFRETGDTTVILAVYPAEALALSGEPIVVQLTITQGLLVEAAYSASVEGQDTDAQTTFRTLSDITPITAPPA